MKTIKILFILFVTVSIIAPMVYAFLSTFFSADSVFYIAIFCALIVGITGINADLKKNPNF